MGYDVYMGFDLYRESFFDYVGGSIFTESEGCAKSTLSTYKATIKKMEKLEKCVVINIQNYTWFDPVIEQRYKDILREIDRSVELHWKTYEKFSDQLSDKSSEMSEKVLCAKIEGANKAAEESNDKFEKRIKEVKQSRRRRRHK